MQFQINEFGKFQDQSQRFAAIFGAGLENVFGDADKNALLGLLGGGQAGGQGQAGDIISILSTISGIINKDGSAINKDGRKVKR